MVIASGLLAICSPFTPADVQDIMRGLRAIQHRGPHTWGVSCVEKGTIVGQTNIGLVPNNNISKPYPIQTAIAHVGYCVGTNSSIGFIPKKKELAQPALRTSHRGDFAVAFNGKLGPIRFLETEQEERGVIIKRQSDIERLVHAIQKHKSKKWLEVVHSISANCLAAYTFVILTSEGIYYARDVNGYRPLFMTQCFKNKQRLAVVISSEQISGAESLKFISEENIDYKQQHRSIAPGTLGYVRLDSSWKEWCINPMRCPSTEHFKNGLGTTPTQSLKQRCALEAIHFMRGGGQFDELVIDYFREECGRRLAQEDTESNEALTTPFFPTVVVGCPRSGISAGRGYAAASGIPYVQAIRVACKVIRNKDNKNFKTQNVVKRRKSIPELLTTQSLTGRRVILVDDLLIDPTGIKRVINLLREAGASRIDVRIASPEIVTNCNWGTYLPDMEDLVDILQKEKVSPTAYKPSALSNFEAHSIKYLSLNGFKELIGSGFCDHCFLQP